MKRWATVTTTVAGGIAAGAVAAAALGAARWNRATARMIQRLMTTSVPLDDGEAPPVISARQFEGLPAPVTRYFSFALSRDGALVRTARLRWEGEFRTNPGGKWIPFSAVQHFTVRPPGFVWDATMRMAPLVAVRVRDSYVAGEGVMLGKIAALLPVADQRGTREIAAGALSRYLGEAVWLPTALLPGAGVSWTAIDDSSARATLVDGSASVSGDFRFGPRGEILGVSMMRYRDVSGRAVPTPFEGRYASEYHRVAGMMIPTGGEVAWLLPEGRFVYWRGRIAEATYDP